MTVVVAFILEAFMFKIQYRHTIHENHSIDYLICHQHLSLDEVHMINNCHITSWSGQHIRAQASQTSMVLVSLSQVEPMLFMHVISYLTYDL